MTCCCSSRLCFIFLPGPEPHGGPTKSGRLPVSGRRAIWHLAAFSCSALTNLLLPLDLSDGFTPAFWVPCTPKRVCMLLVKYKYILLWVTFGVICHYQLVSMRGVSAFPSRVLDSCCFLASSVSFLKSLCLADRNSPVLCNRCQTARKELLELVSQ